MWFSDAGSTAEDGEGAGGLGVWLREQLHRAHSQREEAGARHERVASMAADVAGRHRLTRLQVVCERDGRVGMVLVVADVEGIGIHSAGRGSGCGSRGVRVRDQQKRLHVVAMCFPDGESITGAYSTAVASLPRVPVFLGPWLGTRSTSC